MKLYEYEAADIFSGAGIRVPERILAATPEEVVQAAEKIGYPVVIKAQILAGGRGLAGGIKVTASTEETAAIAEDILNTKIHQIRVRSVLVSRKIEIEKECFLSISVDGYNGQPMIMTCRQGGTDIEKTARLYPEKIATMHVDIQRGLLAFEARKLLKRAGFPPSQVPASADVLVRLYQIFTGYQAMTAEINPLAICQNGALMALDAKLELDDSALPRLGKLIPGNHQRLESSLEKMGREIGVTYIDLKGDIGIISSGAGLGMATMDIIGQKLRPANFLETGGGITDELLYKTMELIMLKKGLRAIFINIYGGINPIHEGARGIARYLRENPLNIPVVAKALGNRQEETWDILRSAGVHVVTDVSTENAVSRLLEILSAASDRNGSPNLT